MRLHDNPIGTAELDNELFEASDDPPVRVPKTVTKQLLDTCFARRFADRSHEWRPRGRHRERFAKFVIRDQVFGPGARTSGSFASLRMTSSIFVRVDAVDLRL
jgi:hypothetical protein